MNEGDLKTSIWSRRRSEYRGEYWKFECYVMQKHSEKRKLKYETSEQGILFIISKDRPSRNYFKGRKKGTPQKLSACQHCSAEYSANMKICPNCLKMTGFWSK